MIKIFSVANSTYFLTENKVYAAGNNKYGQLGLGDNENRYIPTEIKFLTNKNIVKIIGGYAHAFAISENGDVYIWGLNGLGQLSVDDNINQTIPVKNETLSNFISKDIKSGVGHNLLVENRTLYTWGSNRYGQLGLGDTINRNTPTEIEFFSNNNISIKDAYAGYHNSFVTTNDNKLYVWGENFFWQLGLGDKKNREIPTELEFFRGIPIKDIKTGRDSTFILTQYGQLYSFGFNFNGDLGLGHYNYANIPQLINVDKKSVCEIITGCKSTIAKTKDGAIYFWGWNDLISSDSFNKKSILLPERLIEIEAFDPVEIKRGYSSTFFRHKNGDIYVRGINYYGELGLGDDDPVLLLTKLDLNPIQ